MEEAGRWQLINATLNSDGHRLRSLLSKKPSIDLSHACQLFHLAAACGSTENLKTLLAFIPSLNVNCKDETGCTALHKAASAGHREIIHFLIYHGAQVDAQEYLHGNSPLHEAASKGFSRSVEALCLSRASPNLQNKHGLTPLHVAAQNGHKQCTRILIFSGADLGAPNKNGDTCLHTATRYGRAGVVRILLAAKANVMATNKNRDTPLHVAAELKRTKIARCLIEASANGPTPVSSTSSVPGGILRKRNSPPACGPLPPAQSALWICNAQGEKPVDVARRKGNNDLVTFLVTQMNEIGQSAHYENHAAKSLAYPDNNRPKAAPPKLYVSSDLIYPSMNKGAGFKLYLKTRKLHNKQRNSSSGDSNSTGMWTAQSENELKPSNVAQVSQVNNYRQREISVRSDLSDQMTQSFTNLSTSEGPAYSTGILKTKMRYLRHPLFGLFKRENVKSSLPLLTAFTKTTVPLDGIQSQTPGIVKLPKKNGISPTILIPSVSFSGAPNGSHSSLTGKSILQEQTTFSLDESFHKDPPSDQLHQIPQRQDSDNTSADVSSIHLPVDPFTRTNNNGNNAARPAIHYYARAGHGASGQRCQPLPLLGQISAPRRLGVRFDLDGEKAEQTAPSPRHHLTMQLYRDLAGNLKKGPVSSPSACNCVQRQAEYLAGKVPHFVPCSVHAYLDVRASGANSLPPNQSVARKHSERVNPPSKQFPRSHSDESLSVNEKKGGAKPASNDSAPVQFEKKPITAPLPDVCMGSPSIRPISVNYEDASGWSQDEKAKGESDNQQKVSKSKSYSEQMTVAEVAPNAVLINGCSVAATGCQPVTSPLYMSCLNIDGKMGLSVGCASQAIPSAP